MATALLSAGFLLAMTSCVSIEIDDQKWRCDISAECGQGWQCNSRIKQCVAAYEGRRGVFSDRIVLGTSLPDKSTTPGIKNIAQDALAGMESYVSFVNRTGGIHGRSLELTNLTFDFDVDPTKPREEREADAAVNIKAMAGSNGERPFFAMVSVFGTEQSIAGLNAARTENTLLWAPGTGSNDLEPDQTPERFVFNFRARFSDESRLLTRYLNSRFQPKTLPENIATVIPAPGGANIIATDNDTKTMADGVEQALGEIDGDRAITPGNVTWTFEPESLIEAPMALLKWMARSNGGDKRVESSDGKIYVGVVLAMEGTFAARLMRDVLVQVGNAHLRKGNRKFGEPVPDLDPPFATRLSSAEKDQLAKVVVRFASLAMIGPEIFEQLRKLPAYQTTDAAGNRITAPRIGTGLVISQTIPPLSSGGTGVSNHRENLKVFDAKLEPNVFTFEAYLSIQLLGEALRRHGRDITTESIVNTLEGDPAGDPNAEFSVDLGIGIPATFSNKSHQAFKTLWGLEVDDQLNSQAINNFQPEQ